MTIQPNVVRCVLDKVTLEKDDAGGPKSTKKSSIPLIQSRARSQTDYKMITDTAEVLICQRKTQTTWSLRDAGTVGRILSKLA
jgi:hypothetical protein